MFNVQFSFRGVREEQRRLEQFGRQLGKAALFASDKAATLGQRRIRASMAGARLAKLSKTVRVGSDLKKGTGPSVGTVSRRWRAGAYIYRNDGSARAGGAWEAYSKGTVIVPKRGRWLAFPTGNVPKRAGRRKITPSGYKSAGLEAKHGPLVFITGPRAGVAYLIAKDVSVPGANAGGVARKRGKRGGVGAGRQAREFVVMFILIRRTVRGRRFDPVTEARAEAARAPEYMGAYLARNARGAGMNFGPSIARSGGAGRGRMSFSGGGI